VLQVALGKRDKILVFGDDYDTPDGTCIRDYVHVSDLADAHLLALTALDERSRTYNLGNGSGFSVKEVIKAARRITGHPIPVTVVPRRRGDVARLVADSTKIQRELGWKPRLPELDRIIDSAWRWPQKFPAGYPRTTSRDPWRPSLRSAPGATRDQLAHAQLDAPQASRVERRGVRASPVGEVRLRPRSRCSARRLVSAPRGQRPRR
jgi:hypothetical protein